MSIINTLMGGGGGAGEGRLNFFVFRQATMVGRV